MKRILIVHGIHTRDSAGWMDRFVDAFRDAGWDASKWTYGYVYAVLTRWQNPGRAEKLAATIRRGDVVLGHSNGCCLAWMAAKLGAPIGGAILLNPALDTDKVMAKQVPWVNLYPNRHDHAVPFAGFFPRHPWGPQGRDGISVKDGRYRLFFTDEGIPNRVPRVKGHSGVLEPGNIEPWAARIIADANERIFEQQVTRMDSQGL